MSRQDDLDVRKGTYFDVLVAKAYINKMKNASSRDIEFNLPFAVFKNLYRAKYCQLTGIPITLNRNEGSDLPDTLTVDRIDSSKGYVQGNVMAVSKGANQFKALFECGGPFNYNSAIKIGKKLDKLKKSGKIVISKITISK